MKYYILNLISNSVYVCDSIEEMINWFSYYNYNPSDSRSRYDCYFLWKKPRNSVLLYDIAMNRNDKTSIFSWDGKKATPCQRKIMVIDQFNRVIDPRFYTNEILNTQFSLKYRRKRKYLKENYTFRRGPVPGIHKRIRHRGTHYRHPLTTNERRLNSDNEIKEYIRGSRRPNVLINVWDEIPRQNDKCWKNKKIKKQWMKHLK